jgi:hypothetical protein
MNEQNKIEKLMEKAGVSYNVAVSALEASDWDLLNAIIFLEKHDGKAESVKFSTKNNEKKCCLFSPDNSLTALDKGFFKWLYMVIKKANETRVEIVRKDRTLLSIPLTAAIIIFLVTIRETPIIIVISLFFGCQYRIMNDLKNNEDKTETGGSPYAGKNSDN